MNLVEKSLSNLQAINERYGRLAENSRIITFLPEMSQAKVCVPIIGKFSSGKSRAINTIFGYTILKQDVTPETAFPTEIQYPLKAESAEQVHVFYKAKDADGQPKKIIYSLNQYMEGEREKLNPQEVDYIRLYTSHEFFQSINQINLVDMPGFDSGNNMHDRAINSYVSQSMAYIIAFPAEPEGMIVHESLVRVFEELIELEVPVCVMITKRDKASDTEYKELLKGLKTSLEKSVGLKEKDYKLIETSSQENDVEELKDYLLQLQRDSGILLHKHTFLPFYFKEANATLMYLKTLLENSSLSESKLKEEEARIKKEMEQLIAKTTDYTRKFKSETAMCAQEIISDVQSALSRELDTYVSIVMNGDEQSVSERINSTVRITVQSSFQSRFISKAQKYAEKVTAEIAAADAVIMGVPGAADAAADTSGSSLVAAVGGAVAGGLVPTLLPGLAGSLAAGGIGITGVALGSLAIPVVGILAAIGGIIGLIVNKIGAEKKRAEARAKTRQQIVTSVFPAVLAQLRPTVETEVQNKTAEICSDIENSIQERQANFEKALADCRKMLEEESAVKRQKTEEITHDIHVIEEDINYAQG